MTLGEQRSVAENDTLCNCSQASCSWISALVFHALRRLDLFSCSGDSEVQRTMLELLNQLDGFEPKQNIKVRLSCLLDYMHLFHMLAQLI